MLPPVHFHIIKIDVKWWAKTCLHRQNPNAKQIAFAAVLYYGQVFVFSRLINKSVSEWFLLIICK